MSDENYDEERFNMEVRKFLKKVGITSQREIERAVRDGLESGRLKGGEHLAAQVTLRIADVDMEVKIDGDIALG